MLPIGTSPRLYLNLSISQVPLDDLGLFAGYIESDNGNIFFERFLNHGQCDEVYGEYYVRNGDDWLVCVSDYYDIEAGYTGQLRLPPDPVLYEDKKWVQFGGVDFTIGGHYLVIAPTPDYNSYDIETENAVYHIHGVLDKVYLR